MGPSDKNRKTNDVTWEWTTNWMRERERAWEKRRGERKRVKINRVIFKNRYLGVKNSRAIGENFSKMTWRKIEFSVKIFRISVKLYLNKFSDFLRKLLQILKESKNYKFSGIKRGFEADFIFFFSISKFNCIQFPWIFIVEKLR